MPVLFFALDRTPEVGTTVFGGEGVEKQNKDTVLEYDWDANIRSKANSLDFFCFI